MISKNIIHNWAFRLFTPLLFGFFIYVLVLLFFDSAIQLFDHFLSIEYLICVVLCYTNFEIWRIIIKICQKKCASTIWKQIALETGISFLSGIMITWLLIWLYFKHIVGFVNFTSELVIFCSLIGASAIVYHMVFTSQFLLAYKHQNVIAENEKITQESVERWHRFQNRINPNLLYASLERLIGLTYQNKEKAENLIMELTGLYRKVLENHDELILITKEIELLERFKALLFEIYDGHIILNLQQNLVSNYYIIPGFVLLKIEQIINRNINNKLQPLTIELNITDEILLLSYIENKKISPQNESLINLNKEEETLEWYTHKKISIEKSKNSTTEVKIPLINLSYETT